jgi:hypothetical protein
VSDGFKADMATNNLFQLMLQAIAEGNIIAERRRRQSDGEVNIAVGARTSLGAAAN